MEDVLDVTGHLAYHGCAFKALLADSALKACYAGKSHVLLVICFVIGEEPGFHRWLEIGLRVIHTLVVEHRINRVIISLRIICLCICRSHTAPSHFEYALLVVKVEAPTHPVIWALHTSLTCWTAERVQAAFDNTFSYLVNRVKPHRLEWFIIELFKSKSSFNLLARFLHQIHVVVVISLVKLIEQAEDTFIDELPYLEGRDAATGLVLILITE